MNLFEATATAALAVTMPGLVAPDYIIDRDAEGRPMTKTSQVSRCGNSVCPPLSQALVRANAPSLAGQIELPAAEAA